MTRVAAIDCGTNSIRLLIADHDGDRLQEVLRRTEIVRLGQGVDVSGRIAPEAMERTLARSREYAGLAREHGVTAARFVATSASRDASNAGSSCRAWWPPSATWTSRPRWSAATRRPR
ncbi:hypothetical protein GCM10025872_28690 [Barrientosiimonas endolithica]|uniref:Ppx/GppA phosphatase N-terminal domain-containing protein n=1 Tax=Barrientosiimonas endolithica TaxID=1535208 RepID=A0ABM8HE03_9MICO|nr:hypothetical protein GCM10025872_28690 [Barrientosiimonas endolithica]